LKRQDSHTNLNYLTKGQLRELSNKKDN
jgi:hypothetical protein